MREPVSVPALPEATSADGREFQALLGGRDARQDGVRTQIEGVRVGTLVAFGEEGTVPLVSFEGQPGSMALPARTALDLHGSHIGRDVVLMFDGGDPHRPIVMGCLRDRREWPSSESPGRIEVDADGQRLVVSAREQMVLRCGKASITLTRAGKILIQGGFILSRSSGVNRIKGGSVEIN